MQQGMSTGATTVAIALAGASQAHAHTISCVPKRISAEGGIPSLTTPQGRTQFVIGDTEKFERAIYASRVKIA